MKPSVISMVPKSFVNGYKYLWIFFVHNLKYLWIIFVHNLFG